jgi:alpha-ketoglutaric semialdehyde dehydrogenase
METPLIPENIVNWIGGDQAAALSAEWFDKRNPADGTVLTQVARSMATDVDLAIESAFRAQGAWAETPPVKRGEILHDVAMGLKAAREEVARCVHLETGKSMKDALGETDGAVALGLFMSGEGQRMYGRTTTSGVPNRYAMTVRQPIGVAGLIIAANTPIANVAWKVFPALVCGNSAVLKAAEDTPATAWLFSRIAHESGLAPGVLNVVQGLGEEAGAPLVRHPKAGVISFTGSTAVGRQIASVAGQRLARISLELGGKNPLVVCDDANLEQAARWVILSAFSNAGQRCASCSRVIILDAIYDLFRQMLVESTERLRLGISDEDDFGPVINERQLNNMVSAVQRALNAGAVVLAGGKRLDDKEHRHGYYMAPTIIEGVPPEDSMSVTELFGPIACLYRVKTFAEALALANDSPYGLTASIHTRSIHRAMQFADKVQAGVAVVNAGTYGSEPHMPFGGLKVSGNGTREPGTEALDVYSELKNIAININSGEVE